MELFRCARVSCLQSRITDLLVRVFKYIDNFSIALHFHATEIHAVDVNLNTRTLMNAMWISVFMATSLKIIRTENAGTYLLRFDFDNVF